MDRKELQAQFIDQLIDGMDSKTLESALVDLLSERYGKLSDSDLIAEINDYYPELLD